MTRLALIIALVLAPTAGAYHSFPGDPHWPTTTVSWNGHQHANPQMRWVHVIDRTGFGETWRTKTLPQALAAVSAASGYRFSFTTTRGSRFYLWTSGGGYRISDAYALTPVGSIFLGYNAGFGTWTTCDQVGTPQPYCGTNPQHTAKGVVAVDNGGAHDIRHELGHVLGLDHRRDGPYYGCDGQSVMCGLGIYPNFDSHDKAELGGLYGHAD